MTSAQRPGLRERQRQETHLLIRRTAHQLAVERGVAGLSVQAICAAAGVSARTFFNHFRSKDEALIPDLPDFPAESLQPFVDGVEPDLVTALQRLLTDHVACLQQQETVGDGPLATAQLLAENPELLPRALAVFESIERRLAALVARRTGRADDDLFCTVAAMAATSALRAAFVALPDCGADAEGRALVRLPAAFDALRRLATGAPPPALA